ncbi:MAG TPA: hypothetical protein VN901_00400 [Candidatus Acidoferrales bacterium]|nr:hypothetical protein [Candidatus Acidoferrales bacterium]
MDSSVPQNAASAGMRFHRHIQIVRCSICEQLVSVESAKSDEYGRTIHEECYALKMKLKQATS